ncbi:LysR substrate-binding domain-containing protein [Streptomyces sp. NPDC050548]|uniref:LysR substrate-binding domain-containing protein n=1 Tax=Streptomyces sp. NPDC050548 TaxID=3365629 RepID=UPI00379ACE58
MSGRLTPRSRRAAFRPGRLRAAALGAALATVLVPALSACGGDASTAGGNATLKWASSYFPTHWDPVVGGSGAQFRELALTDDYVAVQALVAAGLGVSLLPGLTLLANRHPGVSLHRIPGMRRQVVAAVHGKPPASQPAQVLLDALPATVTEPEWPT